MPQELDKQEGVRLTMTIANAYECEITVKDSSGTVIDLSSASQMVFSIKDESDDLDANAFLSKTIDLTDTDHDLTNGLIYLKLTLSDTNTLTEGRFVWDIRMWRTGTNSPRNFPQPPGEVVVLPRIRRGTP